MSAVIFKMTLKKPEESSVSRKGGIITGIRDRSDVESMIQRYLELAQSALKDADSSAPQSDQEIPA